MENHYLNFKLLTLICLIGIEFSFGQTTLYIDNFTGENGKGQIGTTLDFSGVDWTIDTSGGSFSDNSDFFAVQSEVFKAQDVNGDVIFTSESFTISGYNNLSFSFDAGASGDFEASSDIFIVEVIIDGGAPQVLFEGVVDESISGDPMFFGPTQLTSTLQTFSSSISGTGNNAIIQITVNNNVGTENYYFDNLEVKGFDSGVNIPPSISNVIQSPVSGINSSDTVSISADVTDDDGTINSVELNWGISSGNLNNTINMSNSSGNMNTYQTDTDIPVQSDGTTVYYQIVAEDDELAITTTTELSYNVSDAIIIAQEDFDGTSPSWPNNISDQTFVDPTDSDEGLFIQTSSNIGSGNTAFGKDLDGESGEPTLSPFTFTFDEIAVENFSNLVLSFDYYAFGNADSGSYQLVIDDVPQTAVLFYDDPELEPVQGTITESISGAPNSIQLIITGTLNGSNDVIELDNFKIEGNYDGNLVYSNGIWLESIAPSSTTISDDALVQDGTYTTNGDINLNSISVLGDASVEISPSNVLTIGSTINNNGTFTFKSDATGTAQLAEANGVIINGDVTVERYIPAKRAFRLLSSPLTTTEFIFENWQESGSTPSTPNGLGTHITGGNASLGFDQSGSNNPSMFTFDNTNSNNTSVQTDDWYALSNTNATKLIAGEPYLTFVRGDRTIDLTDNDATPNETTLRATGDLFTGSFSPTLSSTNENYSLVANPYQAIVDYSSVSKTDLTNFIYIWDASIAGSNGRGGYVTVEVSTGDITAPLPTSSDASKFIAPGMAFFVENLDIGTNSPSLIFEEVNKATGQVEVSVFNTFSDFYINSRLYKTTDLQVGNSESDAIGLRFSDSYTTLANDEDAGKLFNPGENYAIVNNGLRSIDKQGMPGVGHEIDLSISNYEENNYSLTYVIENKPSGLGVFLNDNYLNAQTELTEGFVYNFSVDPNVPESIAENRFSLIFDNTTLGIDDNTFGSDFSLFPNPSENGQFSIKTSGISGEVNIEITSVLGQQIYSQKQSAAANKVDVAVPNLSAGVYVVKLTKENQSFITKLIVE